MNETLDRLNEQINYLLDQIPLMEGAEREKALHEVEELHKLRIDELKHEEEVSQHEKELKEAKKGRIGGWIVNGLGIIVPTGFGAILMNKGFKFETTGTYCSKTFTMLLQKVLGRFGR